MERKKDILGQVIKPGDLVCRPNAYDISVILGFTEQRIRVTRAGFTVKDALANKEEKMKLKGVSCEHVVKIFTQ